MHHISHSGILSVQCILVCEFVQFYISVHIVVWQALCKSTELCSELTADCWFWHWVYTIRYSSSGRTELNPLEPKCWHVKCLEHATTKAVCVNMLEVLV